PAALERLLHYHWPGNIRELENVLSRAAILSGGAEIGAGDLDLVGLHDPGASPAAAAAAPEPLGDIDAAAGLGLREVVDRAVRRIERRAITLALEAEGGSPTRAARRLGISRASIYNKLKEHGISKGSSDGGSSDG